MSKLEGGNTLFFEKVLPSVTYMTRRITGLFLAALLIALAAPGCDAVPGDCFDETCFEDETGAPPTDAETVGPHPADKVVPSGLTVPVNGPRFRADVRHAPFEFAN